MNISFWDNRYFNATEIKDAIRKSALDVNVKIEVEHLISKLPSYSIDSDNDKTMEKFNAQKESLQ